MNKIIHWTAAILFFGVPIVTMTHSPLLDLTVGAILNAVYLWASHVINPTVNAKA